MYFLNLLYSIFLKQKFKSKKIENNNIEKNTRIEKYRKENSILHNFLYINAGKVNREIFSGIIIVSLVP